MRVRAGRGGPPGTIGLLVLVAAWAGCRGADPPPVVSAADQERAAREAQAAEQARAAGDLDAALEQARVALEIDPLNPDHHMTLARIAAERGLLDQDPQLYSEAMRHADVACTAHPDRAEYLAERGRMQFERHYYTRAIADLSQALELAPSNVELLRTIALAHRGLRQPKAERKAWERLVEARPRDGRARLDLSGLLLRSDDPDDQAEGLRQLEEAVRVAPADSVILHALAERRAAAGDLRAAESLLHRSVAAADDPLRQADALLNLAAAVQAQGRLPEARRHLERALELDPLDPRIVGNLGYVLLELGERHEGRVYLQDALLLNPEGDLERRIRALLDESRPLDETAAAEPASAAGAGGPP